MSKIEKEKIESVLDKKIGGRPSKYPGAEVILSQYADHSASELGKKYGVAMSTVQAWVRKARSELKNE